MAIIEVSTS